MRKHKRALCWIRRDLRLQDHAALSAASSEAEELVILFVFDPKILDRLEDKDDRRLTFILQSLLEIDEELRARGGALLVRIGDPAVEVPKMAKALQAEAVYTNKDYEPYAITRDTAVEKNLQSCGKHFYSYKDQVIFEKQELLTGAGTSFKVFTAYKNAWREKIRLENYSEKKVRLSKLVPSLEIAKESQNYSYKNLGFTENTLWLKSGAKAGHARLKKFAAKIDDYKKARDFPSAEGTSGLSVHLRFGTLSIREALRFGYERDGMGADTWVNELIWRDFYQMILANNPHVVGHSFKKECDQIQWPGKEAHFKAWCNGETGYPIVDASMRHFNATGWMHNRLRMVVAAFFTKDLLLDWRLGEAYFARKLLDFDLAANNGGWQWSASTGCDAQPYFRIFNPYSQSEKFDKNGDFLRANLPELKNVSSKTIHKPEVSGYPEPIVDHKIQRSRAIALFGKG